MQLFKSEDVVKMSGKFARREKEKYSLAEKELGKLCKRYKDFETKR